MSNLVGILEKIYSLDKTKELGAKVRVENNIDEELKYTNEMIKNHGMRLIAYSTSDNKYIILKKY